MTNGYAPGDYTIRCHKCGKHKTGMDKRAITCKECADTMKTTSFMPDKHFNMNAWGISKHGS